MDDDVMDLATLIAALWGAVRLTALLLLRLLLTVWAITLQLRLWWQPATS